MEKGLVKTLAVLSIYGMAGMVYGCNSNSIIYKSNTNNFSIEQLDNLEPTGAGNIIQNNYISRNKTLDIANFYRHDF